MLLLLAACHHTRAGAPQPPPPPSGPDPPWRVARISYAEGRVSMRAAGTDEWTAAEANRPLTSGDALWVEPGGRAELHTGNAALRLDSGTAVSLLEVGTSVVQVKVTAGTVSVHLRELDENEEFELDTPDAAIVLLRAGTYRVEVSGSGPGTMIVARNGMAEVTAPGVSFVLRQQQEARLPGLDAAQRYLVTSARAEDGFDAFCVGRDRREDHALASKRVPPRLIGYEDLEDHGEWHTDVTYGVVWAPRGVAPGWTPYRFGRWVWIEPWGWTWVDDAPWGFAPFHYGRWVFVNGRWVWIPGPWHRYPVYAPALVVFVGGGRPGFRIHLHVNIGFGVAWFPLGPREVWFPPYRASRTYVTHVNVTHTVIRDVASIHRTDIARQVYLNRRAEGAVTAVHEDVFRGARPVHRHAVRLSPREIDTLSIGGSAPPVTPTRGSVVTGERRTAGPARERRPVIVNRTPPPPPVPFEQRRPEIDRSAGRAPEPRRVEEMRREQPARSPDYRQEPRRQAPEVQRPAPPASPRRRADPETQRDRQWEQRTDREEAQRRTRIEKERQQQPQQPQRPATGRSGEETGRRRQ